MQGEESARHRRATEDFTEDVIAVDADVEALASASLSLCSSSVQAAAVT
ncbi:hypothetical protein HQ394_17140 [Defluviicoccus vanus]|uniref:Uncharacterized protein n=1 Tax=Defluviicoccus vanus TaxID=111831 RepID=A0A7H1N4U7_9PROT|nr:hypothetical protein HQ394_17140 [Defluviicoccus vanus]